MVTKKRKREIEAANRREHDKIIAQINAPTIAERFPNVKHISLLLTYSLDGPVGWSKKPEERKYNSSTKTLFEFKCHNHECVNGGFSLLDIIENIINKKETSSSGQIYCQGWEDRNRINQHRCLVELNYTIRIEYRDTA